MWYVDGSDIVVATAPFDVLADELPMDMTKQIHPPQYAGGGISLKCPHDASTVEAVKPNARMGQYFSDVEHARVPRPSIAEVLP